MPTIGYADCGTWQMTAKELALVVLANKGQEGQEISDEDLALVTQRMQHAGWIVYGSGVHWSEIGDHTPGDLDYLVGYLSSPLTIEDLFVGNTNRPIQEVKDWIVEKSPRTYRGYWRAITQALIEAGGHKDPFNSSEVTGAAWTNRLANEKRAAKREAALAKRRMQEEDERRYQEQLAQIAAQEKAWDEEWAATEKPQIASYQTYSLPYDPDRYECFFGTRLIFEEVLRGWTGIVPDRKDWIGNKRHGATVEGLLKALLDQVRSDQVRSSDDRPITLHDGDWVAVANPQSSYGYLYVSIAKQGS